MPAYLIGNIEVTDQQSYEEYRRAVPALISAFGGRYLVRGGAVEQLEGDLRPLRVVVLEFPDMARLRAFYRSPQYQPLLALRQHSARASLFAVEGM